MNATAQIVITDEQVEQIARRAAQLVAERQESVSPWLDTKNAAAHLCCGTDRIHDLVQLGKLTPRRDGRRLLFRRDGSTPTWRARDDLPPCYHPSCLPCK